MKIANPDISALQEKFLTTRRELAATLIERDDEIDVILTSLICRENPLLVGPPGTAKSLLLDSLLNWMNGKRFSILLTRFSTPEEVFGPISVSGLNRYEDRYERITTGKLPEADLAFIDEIWKASSAILNTLLRILNERTFDKGDGKVFKVPLKMCLAASNEWPNSQEGGKELSALFDRFLLRKTVRPILSATGRQRLAVDAQSHAKTIHYHHSHRNRPGQLRGDWLALVHGWPGSDGNDPARIGTGRYPTGRSPAIQIHPCSAGFSPISMAVARWNQNTWRSSSTSSGMIPQSSRRRWLKSLAGSPIPPA
jgi:hypothetical protein